MSKGENFICFVYSMNLVDVVKKLRVRLNQAFYKTWVDQVEKFGEDSFDVQEFKNVAKKARVCVLCINKNMHKLKRVTQQMKIIREFGVPTISILFDHVDDLDLKDREYLNLVNVNINAYLDKRFGRDDDWIHPHDRQFLRSIEAYFENDQVPGTIQQPLFDIVFLYDQSYLLNSVMALYRLITNSNIGHVWLDVEVLNAKQSYFEEHVNAIKNCKLVVYCSTHNSEKSTFIKNLLDTAQNHKKKMILVQMEKQRPQRNYDFSANYELYHNPRAVYCWDGAIVNDLVGYINKNCNGSQEVY